MALTEYNKKRNFKKTPEPKGKGSVKKNHFRFVVQRHDASRLHYDFRLELGGTLKSWAIPKGPSMNPTDKRLAVMVEDHPVSYINFKGEIPEGNYGAGSVEIWDEGLYFPVDVNQEKLTEREALNALENGELKLFMKGEKLEGEFVLVRMQGKNWLLIKHKDEYAVKGMYDSEKFRKQAPGKKKAQKNNATVIVNSSTGTNRKVPGYIVPMEGIIAKKADSYYSPGIRSREWLKIKNQKSQEAIIAGFTAPKGSRMHFGSLLLGQFKGKDMVYIGHAGTGFTDSTLKELRKKMEPYIVSHSPFPIKIPANGRLPGSNLYWYAKGVIQRLHGMEYFGTRFIKDCGLIKGQKISGKKPKCRNPLKQ